MTNTIMNYLNRLKQDRRRQWKAVAVLICLSLIVAGGTTWALHINGESQTGETYCGYDEEHQHSEACVEKVLICGYDTEGTTAAETEAHVHTHDESCYEEQTVLTCELEESAEHTHSEECYDADGNLICGMEESEGHTHSEENGCYTTGQVLVCGLEEGAPETTGAATETSLEIPTHVHTDECYEITYICGFDYEHTHTLSCFSNPEADVETAADWEKTFADVELTGDFATDLVAIAKTQLGYAESADNYQVLLDDAGNETEQTKGYTRYGAWYGMPYEDWCAMFVSFCLNYADITSEMLPYNASCQSWIDTLSGEKLGFFESVYVETLDEDGNTILTRNDYTPEMGDLIFFDWDGDGSANHVGIVEELETKEITNDDGTLSYEYTVHTIEGNSSNKVTQREYDLEDQDIMGYGSLYSAYLSAVDNGLIDGVRRLTAEAADGVAFSAIGEIPENAVLEVSPLTEEQNAYLQENFGLTGSFYDIKIIQEDGTEYQPEEAVKISISGLGYDVSTVLEGFHLTADAEDLMTSEDFETLSVDVQNTGNRIGFCADGFSIYIISEAISGESTAMAAYAETESTSSYITVSEATPVSSFYLWIYKNTTGGDSNKVVGFSEWDNKDSSDTSGNFGSTGITDALTYTDTDNAVYYLVPIKYFTNVKDSLTGFTFDESNPGVCPFVYAPSASSSTANLTDAAYVKYGENWYVRVQDTTGQSPNRSNIYYNPSNSFTLTYNGSTVTFNIVDTSGNPLYGDYSDFSQTLAGSTKYVLGKDPADQNETNAEKMTLPTISGYTYNHAYCENNTGFTVVSFATLGYTTGYNSFRAYGSEPIVSGQWYSNISSITLVYSVATTNSFKMTYGDTTITFNLVDENGEALEGVCGDITAQDGMRYIFGPPSVESHEENERGTNKDKLVWNIAPSVDGYAYHSATWVKNGDTTGETVCSIATAGYEDSLSDSGNISNLRFYSTEGITSGNYADVTDAGSYTVTLVYKTATDNFKLTLKDGDGTELGTITVYVVDLSGNPISGDYDQYNQDLDVNKKYLFDPDDSETDAIQLDIPQYLSDYAYYQTRYASKTGYQVVSVVTKGYTLGANQGTLGTNFRFYNPGGTDANGGYHTIADAAVYLVYAHDMHVITNVASANSTAVNLFDYWISTRDGTDYSYSIQGADDTNGINAEHPLKFHYSSSASEGTFNKWTGRDGGVLQGIVQNKLVNNFPTLSGKTSLGMAEGDTESLAYLFDPSVPVMVDGTSYKVSYRNVQGLFQIDSGGYYYYNAKENFAEFDEETNRFTLYEEAGVGNSDTTDGMFFPFNTIQEAYALTTGENATLNHYFGMAMTTRFIQTYEGHTDASRETANTFQFAGDDDVWIFIDDVLVADLGGIHDATGVTIDFAAGTVTINNVYDGKSGTNSVTTYFSDIFYGTDVELDTYTNDGKTYTTLADNTTHTLKFFYLERGNAASNLYLKYNLNEVPDTSIYKVDQYGDPLEGAAFAVYPSNENGEYLTATDGKTTYISLDDCERVYDADNVTANTYYINLTPDENGQITPNITANVAGTVYTVKAAYYGVTDSQGEMPFVDGDYMPYSASELKKMFGDHFILREVDVPAGYRTVEDEILLKFEGELLQSDDPYGTGVWASPNALVTATNTLYVADSKEFGNAESDATTGAISYYDPTDGTTKGTLFAVVLKRNQDKDTEVTTETVKTWQPVYGSDEKGYDVLSFGGNDDAYRTQLEAVIAAAQLADGYGNVEFGYAASGMQVLLKNLPGDATRYYTYMKENNVTFTTTDPQYMIAYYYTTADNLAGATEDNTVRVRSHGQKVNGETTTTYDAFTVQWGADIEVPNIENRLFFQKLDENSEFVDNAVFALYPVEEVQTTAVDGFTTANYYYTAAASDDGSTAYVRLDVDVDGNTAYGSALVYTATGGTPAAGTYAIQSGSTQSNGWITDSGAGYITVKTESGTYTIKPAVNAAGTPLVGYTHDNCVYFTEDSTGHFQQLMDGKYILREIEAPAGYELNPEEIKVLVSDTAVYANAGTEDNGVAVGNGVGYVVRTLDVFAAEGTIDESLTWIYSMLRVNPSNDSFALVSVENTAQYVKRDTDNPVGYGSDVTTNRSEAMVTYLKYVGSDDDSAPFDYAVNSDTDENGADIGQAARAAVEETQSIATLAGEGKLRLYTTVGWSGLAVYQDYAYGSAQTSTNAGDNADDATTAYSDLSGRDLTNLFSNSTFVQVMDQYSVGDLEISKTVLPEDNDEEFNFTLELSAGEDMITTLAESYYYTIYDVADNGTRTIATGDNITNQDENGNVIATYSGKIKITTTQDEDGNITSQTGSLEITLKNNQVVVIEALPYGTEYTVKEAFALPYTTWISVDDGTSVEDTATAGTLLWREDLNEDNVRTVEYTNALLPLVELVKVDSVDDAVKLAGARFVMYRVVAKTDENGNEIKNDDGTAVTVTEYYNSANGKWVADSEENESKYAMLTPDNGELMIANMNRAGTYYLKELAAPDGYDPLAEIIEFTVEWDDENNRFKITSPTADSPTGIYTVTKLTSDGQQLNMNVKNNTHYELPETGGAGTTMFTLGGLLLTTVALVYGCGRRRKRERRND